MIFMTTVLNLYVFLSDSHMTSLSTETIVQLILSLGIQL
jgi:hypothetical protein